MTPKIIMTNNPAHMPARISRARRACPVPPPPPRIFRRRVALIALAAAMLTATFWAVEPTGVHAQTAPSAPQTLTASIGCGLGTTTITWSAPATGTASKYQTRHKLGTASWPSGGGWTDNSPATATTANLTTSRDGASWDIQVRAVDTSGSSDVNGTAASTTGTGSRVGCPRVVQTLQGQSSGASRTTWIAPADTTVAPTGYEYRWRRRATGSYSSWTAVSGGASARVLDITGVNTSWRVDVQVRAVATVSGSTVNSRIGMDTRSLCCYISSLPVATSLTAMPGAQPGQVVLTWAATSSVDISYRLGPATLWPLGSLQHRNSGRRAVTSSPETTVFPPGSTYELAVSLRNIFGNGGLVTVSGTARAIPEPADFAVTPSGLNDGNFTLTWDYPAPTSIALDGFEYQYKLTTDTSWPASWTTATAPAADPMVAGTEWSAAISVAAGAEIEARVRSVDSVQVHWASSASPYYSAVVEHSTAQTPAPQSLTAAPTENYGELAVSWSPPESGTVAKYQIRFKRDGDSWPAASPNGWADVAPATATSTTVQTTGDGVSWDVEVRSVDSANVAGAAVSTTRHPAQWIPVSWAHAFPGRTINTVDLEWEDEFARLADPPTRLEYRWKPTTGDWADTGAHWRTVPDGELTRTLTGLTGGTQYDVHMRSVKSIGSGQFVYSARTEMQARASELMPATGFSMTPGTLPGQVTLRWTEPPGATITSRTLLVRESSYHSWESPVALPGPSPQTVILQPGSQPQLGIIIETATGQSSGVAKTPTDPVVIVTPIPYVELDVRPSTAKYGEVIATWDAPTDPNQFDSHEYFCRAFPDPPPSDYTAATPPTSGNTWTVKCQTERSGARIQVGVLTRKRLTVIGGTAMDYISDINPTTAVSTPAPQPIDATATEGVELGQLNVSWARPDATDLIGGATVSGWRIRYKLDSVNDWEGIDWTDLAAHIKEHEIRHPTNQGNVAYDIELQTVVDVGGGELVYSPSLELTGRTRGVRPLGFVELPRVNKLEPSISSVTVRAGQRIRLEVNVYDRQDGVANSEVDGGTGLFNDITAVYTWQSEGGFGTFESPNNVRQVTYRAPDQPGTYRITAGVGPPGICLGHHATPQESESCRVAITVRVIRASVPGSPAADPMNPAGLIPTTVTDASGNAYTVFTPVEGGTLSDVASGATVMADPGAVPDQTLVAVRAESLPVPDSGDDGVSALYTIGSERVRVTAADVRGEVLPAYRFDEAIQVCTPLPAQFLDRLDAVTMVRISESGGNVSVLSSTLYQGGSSGLRICGAVSVLPATVAAARVGVTPTATPMPGADIGDIETGGGTLPRILLLSVALAMFLAVSAAVVAARYIVRRRGGSAGQPIAAA